MIAALAELAFAFAEVVLGSLALRQVETRRAQLGLGPTEVRYRHVRIIRDYDMIDRREAPQFYPEVRSSGDRKALPLRRP